MPKKKIPCEEVAKIKEGLSSLKKIYDFYGKTAESKTIATQIRKFDKLETKCNLAGEKSPVKPEPKPEPKPESDEDEDEGDEEDEPDQ